MTPTFNDSEGKSMSGQCKTGQGGKRREVHGRAGNGYLGCTALDCCSPLKEQEMSN